MDGAEIRGRGERMSEYKRLTSGNFNGQCEYYDYYIDGCRIGNFILKCKECPHKERYDRLKEFEDKIEEWLSGAPCKPGDIIYEISYDYKRVFPILVPNLYTLARWIEDKCFGDWLFVTKEEAEARCKELQEKNNG